MLPRPRDLLWLVVLLFCALAVGCTSTESAPASSTQPALLRFASSAEAVSPDGLHRIEIGLDEFGRARYRVLRERAATGETVVVIDDSTLGLETTSLSFAKDLSIASITEPVAFDDTFALPTGKARTAQLAATTRSVTFLSASNPDAELRVDLLAADVGVAFRYVLSGAPALDYLEAERTSFSLPPAANSWLQPHDEPTLFTPAYEQLRSPRTRLDSLASAPWGWTFPALFEHEGVWTLVTETALTDGQAASHFSGQVINGEFVLALPNPGEGNGVGEHRPLIADQARWPWRVLISSEQLSDVVESNLIRHLSPPAEPDADFSWVEPGRVSWSWWSDHQSSRDPAAMRPFIDLASELGWQYSLVDANWNSFGDDELVELVEYAASRNVGLLLWYNSGGPNNAVTEAPRDMMSSAEIRRTEFARIAELGIKGVKVDFFQSDKPGTITQYRDILADAADAKLLVNFHGATLPRGWSREFPNLMTVEAVRGAEMYTFDFGYQSSAPRQNATLPFTRNAVASMDYTPVILGDEVPRQTTNGHELALAVVFESGLQHFVDTPEAYLDQPEEVVQLLREVPTVWDETVLVDGYPGRFVAIARRHGATWWMGIINGTNDEAEIDIDLSRLTLPNLVESESNGTVVVCDSEPGDQPQLRSSAELLAITSAMPTVVTLPAYGGCLARLNR